MIFTAEAYPCGASCKDRRISIDLKDADLHNVFRLLADVGHVNIVVSEAVQGKVTIKLRNVPWRDALKTVLHAKGLGKEEVGNIIHVDTLERILTRAELERSRKDNRMKAAPLKTIMIPVRYAVANELKPIVESLLTPRGRVIVDERTNTLIVTDVSPNTSRIRSSLGL